ncbi:MAG: nucleoside:H(+) symporter NupC [Candidatus Westeberhardia cardiocondylae]|nr:nucleoside:H(+) symporter NupC [Candidatus Westeberhardia cardiocondylae]
MSQIFHFILSFFLVITLTILMSKNYTNIPIRTIMRILITEILLAHFLLNSHIGEIIINKFSLFFEKILEFSSEGTDFVFGNMKKQKLAFFFLNVLCPIIFISSIIGIFQYIRILPILISITGNILSKINGTEKLESCNAISTLLFGQSENFIIYKNVIQKISQDKLLNMAITAMSTTSLSIANAYILIIPPQYVITAIILNMFNTFIIISILNPKKKSKKSFIIYNTNKNKGLFETLEEHILIGCKITIIVTAMLIGFIPLISAVNTMLHTMIGISFQNILGYILFPFAWSLGIPKTEIFQVSEIMAIKIISNEFIAMIELQKISHTLSSNSFAILSVFLVSFANFSSVGIISGAIRGINKKQGNKISKHGFKLIYSATLINILSSAITGLIIKK